jgi:chromosomal replication initiation ATPase DnaA
MKLTKQDMAKALHKVKGVGDLLYTMQDIEAAIGIIEQEALPEQIDTMSKKVLWYGAEYFGLQYHDLLANVKLKSYVTMARNIAMHIAMNYYGGTKTELNAIVGKHRATTSKYLRMIDEVLDGEYPDKALLQSYHSCLQYIKLKLD